MPEFNNPDIHERMQSLVADGKKEEAFALLLQYWNPIAGIDKALWAVSAMIRLAADRYGLEELAHYHDADLHEIDFAWRADQPNKCINVKITLSAPEPEDDR